MSPTSAEQILSPHLTLLRDCVTDGFSDYHLHYGHVSYLHNARTRASAIHDHIVSHVKSRFGGSTSIRKIPIRIRNLFDVDGKLVLQFKKLSKGLRTSNIQTHLTLSLDNKNNITLPGIPPSLPRLSLGYVPKHDWTSIEGVFITYVLNKKLIWYIDLTGLSGNASTLFAPPIQPASPTKKRIRAKPTRQSYDGDSSEVAV